MRGILALTAGLTEWTNISQNKQNETTEAGDGPLASSKPLPYNCCRSEREKKLEAVGKNRYKGGGQLKLVRLKGKSTCVRSYASILGKRCTSSAAKEARSAAVF